MSPAPRYPLPIRGATGCKLRKGCLASCNHTVPVTNGLRSFLPCLLEAGVRGVDVRQDEAISGASG